MSTRFVSSASPKSVRRFLVRLFEIRLPRISTFLVGCVLVACAISLAIASRPIASRSIKSLPVTQDSPQQQPTPQLKTFPLNFYVAPGFPLVVSNAVIISPKAANEKQEGVALAKFTVTNRDAAKVNSLYLALLDFQNAAKLRRVDGWVKDVRLAPGSSTEITFELGRRVTMGDKLILAIERVNGVEATRDTNFLDLAQNVAAVLSGGNPAGPRIESSSAILPDDSGAALCSNAFRRAMALTQTGDKSGVTSFTCDQAERSFTFTFNGKTLGK